MSIRFKGLSSFVNKLLPMGGLVRRIVKVLYTVVAGGSVIAILTFCIGIKDHVEAWDRARDGDESLRVLDFDGADSLYTLAARTAPWPLFGAAFDKRANRIQILGGMSTGGYLADLDRLKNGFYGDLLRRSIRIHTNRFGNDPFLDYLAVLSLLGYGDRLSLMSIRDRIAKKQSHCAWDCASLIAIRAQFIASDFTPQSDILDSLVALRSMQCWNSNEFVVMDAKSASLWSLNDYTGALHILTSLNLKYPQSQTNQWTYAQRLLDIDSLDAAQTLINSMIINAKEPFIAFRLQGDLFDDRQKKLDRQAARGVIVQALTSYEKSLKAHPNFPAQLNRHVVEYKYASELGNWGRLAALTDSLLKLSVLIPPDHRFGKTISFFLGSCLSDPQNPIMSYEAALSYYASACRHSTPVESTIYCGDYIWTFADYLSSTPYRGPSQIRIDSLVRLAKKVIDLNPRNIENRKAHIKLLIADCRLDAVRAALHDFKPQLPDSTLKQVSAALEMAARGDCAFAALMVR